MNAVPFGKPPVVEYVFKMDASAVATILNALSRLPYGEVAGLIAGIREEVARQQAPPGITEPMDSVQPKESTDGRQVEREADQDDGRSDPPAQGAGDGQTDPER